MPHITVQHFPKDLTAEARQRLAEEITATVVHHFGVPEGAVSILLEAVPEAEWNHEVLERRIAGREHLLIKEPRYAES
jgi:4-oxalocrotonate tautomerase